MAGAKSAQAGVTLLELTFAMAILTIVMGVLFTLSLSIGDTARVHDVKISAVDEGQRALLRIGPLLRQAQRTSINLDEMPVDILRFRVPADLDNNGLAVDAENKLELGGEITVRRDKTDQNKDGFSMSQLIMIQGEDITVLANNVSPDTGPTPGASGIDTVPVNRAGFWVEEVSGRISVTIRTQGESRRGHIIRQEFTQLIEPRN